MISSVPLASNTQEMRPACWSSDVAFDVAFGGNKASRYRVASSGSKLHAHVLPSAHGGDGGDGDDGGDGGQNCAEYICSNEKQQW